MLYTIDGKKIKEVPHKEMLTLFFKKLSQIEIDLIDKKLQETIDMISEDKKLLNSSFLPGKDWTGTVFQPIYEKAAGYNEELVAKIYGLVLMKNIIDNDKEWVFMKDGEENRKGSIYFIKEY